MNSKRPDGIKMLTFGGYICIKIWIIQGLLVQDIVDPKGDGKSPSTEYLEFQTQCQLSIWVLTLGIFLYGYAAFFTLVFKIGQSTKYYPINDLKSAIVIVTQGRTMVLMRSNLPSHMRARQVLTNHARSNTFPNRISNSNEIQEFKKTLFQLVCFI